MKQTAANWMAIACAATASAPIRPMTKTAALNTVASSATATPMGRPSATRLRNLAKSKRQKWPKMR